MRIILIFILVSNFNLANEKDTLIIDSLYNKNNNIWKKKGLLLKKKPFNSINQTLDRNWKSKYRLDITFNSDGKKYFVFSIKNYNRKEEKYNVSTYFTYNTNDGIWVATLLFYEANYASDKPVKGKLWSKIVLEETVIIFNDLNIIEEFNIKDLW